MGKTLMIIILPIRLDGVGFLLRREKALFGDLEFNSNGLFHHKTFDSRIKCG